jgi:O-antigen/teichoic acid export membrane protein
LTNLLAPILTTIDRMMIGSVLSAAAVAYYAVPFNLVTRVSVLPGALSTSLFPKLSRQNQADSRLLAHEAVFALAAAMTPVVVAGIIAMPIFMRLWVGAGFAVHAAPVAMILLIGIWVNGLAYIPYGLLQANNRPDLTAKFHALELLPFLAILWFGIQWFGLIGAACAWTVRVAADAVLLFVAAGQAVGWAKLLPGFALVALAPFVAPTQLISIHSMLAFVLVAGACFWSWMISTRIRSILVGQFTRLAPGWAT